MDTCIHEDIGEKGFERTHLRSARDGTSCSGIDRARFYLLLLLPVTGIPKRLDSSVESFVKLG